MRTALIGVGMVADTYVRALAGLRGAVDLRGVMGRDPERARAFAEGLSPAPRVYADLGALTDDGGLDFVIVATPPDARMDIVGRLVDAGLPVLCEKPLERSYAGARDLVRLAEAAGVPMGVVLQHRMRPAVTALRARLAEGALGEIAAVELRLPWWRDQAYYDEPGRGSYARDGGGVLITQAVHSLDLMVLLAGPVRRVQAMLGTTALHRMDAEDFAAAGLEFESGALGAVMASTASYPGGTEEITLHGTRASAHLAGPLLTITGRDGGVEQVGSAAGSGGGADPMAFSADWHRDVIADFSRAVADGSAPCVPARSALCVHALIDAMALSSRLGRRVVVASEVENG